MTLITIIGGGITGLAAAWELASRSDVTVQVLEAAPRFGGKIHTSAFAGSDLDEGADAFLVRTPDALRLCAELGIDTQQITHPRPGQASVWWDGRLHPLPHGLTMGLPLDPSCLAGTELLSAAGIARALREPDLPGLPIHEDRAIGPFVAERFGDEVAERLVGPLLGAIAAGDINTMSLDAVLPQIATLARGSSALTGAGTATPIDTGPVFAAPVGGMGRLIDALVEQLPDRGVRLITDAAIDALPAADGVLITTPSHTAANLVRAVSPQAAVLLSAVPLVSVAFVALAFPQSAFAEPPTGTGFLVPRSAGLSITAASWSSNKWAHLDDGNQVIVRAAVGHRHDDRVDTQSDDELIAAVLADLHTTVGINIGITTAPSSVRVSRYPRGFPQYDVGHLGRVAEIEASLATDAPHVAVTGMAHRGVGIPACIREGRAAARSLADKLAS